MTSRIRRILDMVLRVLGFVHANPSDDPAQTAAVARLEERAARLQVLAEQEQSGHITVEAAVVTKEDQRAKLKDDLHVLSQMAATASEEEPTLPVRLSIPKPHSSAQTFLTGCRVVITESQAKLETLGKLGLTAEFLTQMSQRVDQFAQAIEAKNIGLGSHVGASGELTAVAVEVNRLVRLLDAVYRTRFRNDPEKRAAWKSARTVVRSSSKPVAEPVKPGGEPGQAAA